jgi:hypothetical protein
LSTLPLDDLLLSTAATNTTLKVTLATKHAGRPTFTAPATGGFERHSERQRGNGQPGEFLRRVQFYQFGGAGRGSGVGDVE